MSHLFPMNPRIANTRNKEKFYVQPALTSRLAKSAIPYMQCLLNEDWVFLSTLEIFCSAWSRSQIQNQSFGRKQSTKLTVDHPPTYRKLFVGF